MLRPENILISINYKILHKLFLNIFIVGDKIISSNVLIQSIIKLKLKKTAIQNCEIEQISLFIILNVSRGK